MRRDGGRRAVGAWRGALAFAALLALAPLHAAQPTLWRVERPGTAASHLVGIATPSTAAQAARVERLLGQAQTLVLARELDAGGLFTALPAAFEPSAAAERTAADPALMRRAKARLRERGVFGEKVSQLKPWAFGLGLGAPPGREDPLELRLLRAAGTAKKKVAVLETLAEGAAALNTLPVAEQEAMVRAGLARGPRAPTLLEATLDAWKKQDVARLQQLLHATHQRLNGDRSESRQRRVAARLDTLLAEGNVLVLIDPALLAEGSLVIRTLRSRGWSAAPSW